MASTGKNFAAILDEATTLLRKARKHRHSLTGTGYYAKAYWEKVGEIRRVGEGVIRELERKGFDEDAKVLRTSMERLASSQESTGDIETELARARTTWCVKVEPALHNGTKQGKLRKSFLPPELRASTPGILRPVYDQIEGCYAYEFRDAALVMLRKLVEALIIEGYVRADREGGIKRPNGEYLDFGELVGKVKSGDFFRLGRDSRATLDEVHSLSRNAAHNAGFNAQRSHLENLRTRVGILVQELLRHIESMQIAKKLQVAETLRTR